MESNQMPPYDGSPVEAELYENINVFWKTIQSKNDADPISTLQDASEIWNAPLVARLPDTDGPFYSHHACSLDESREIMAFLDQRIDSPSFQSSTVLSFQEDLPDSLRQRYPGGIICCQFIQNNLVTGYIALAGTRELNALDNAFLLNLRGILVMQFQTDQYNIINRGISNTLLFRALLEDRDADMDLYPIEHFIDQLPKSDIWKCHIMLVDCNNDSLSRMRFFCDVCKTMVTCSLSAIYDGKIVMLYHGRDKYPVQEHHIFIEYLRSHKLCCAVSQGFTKIENVPKYYAQAKAAMDIGSKISPEDVLYLHEKYAPYHAIQLAANLMGVDAILSPRLMQLNNYDEVKGTELLKTVRVYLDNLNDASTTSAKLNIHRNTLFYRLKKIEEITGWDLNNGKNLDDIFFFLRVLDITDYL